MAADRGVVCVTPDLPAEHSREMGLFQEAIHHDVELGGWDYWNNADAKYGASVLRLLSTDNSRMAFPEYVLPHLFPDGTPGGRRLRALDIGCGSLSHLRWGAVEGWLDITGVDPLLDMYAVIRERHGLSVLPHIRCDSEICGAAETLDVGRLADSFDFVLCTNALDHTEDPAAIVRHVGAVLKAGGLAALQVYTREGSREAWWQLHQFDMFMDGDRFMAQSRDGTAVDLIASSSGLEIANVLTNNEHTTRLLARKRA
jgi:SAM-dependent methyltransferase